MSWYNVMMWCHVVMSCCDVMSGLNLLYSLRPAPLRSFSSRYLNFQFKEGEKWRQMKKSPGRKSSCIEKKKNLVEFRARMILMNPPDPELRHSLDRGRGHWKPSDLKNKKNIKKNQKKEKRPAGNPDTEYQRTAKIKSRPRAARSIYTKYLHEVFIWNLNQIELLQYFSLLLL